MKFAERAKAYAALLFGILTALSATTGVIPEAAQPYVAVALAILGGFVTFKVENADPPAEPGDL